MKRREFMGAGALAAALGTAAMPTARAADALPMNQGAPLPDLGSHWPLFESLSQGCRPAMSYLADRYTDPASWADEARAALRADFHYAGTPEGLHAQVVATMDRGDFTQRYVLLNGTGGTQIPLYLLIPKNVQGPTPAVVALHDHGGFYFWGKEKLVGVEPVHPALQAFKERYYGGRSIADDLARRGYVVAVPDMLHWGERGLYFEADPERVRNRTMDVTDEDIKQFNARAWAHEDLIGRSAFAAGTTYSGIITQDDYQVADYLCSLPEVDGERVGCLGLSLGSVRSMYLGALHPRVRASVAVCWMAAYQQMMRNNIRWAIGFTKLVPGLYSKLDWPDLGGLHWPGALMTINGLKDELYPLGAAQDAVDKLGRIFEKMGARDNYRGLFFDGPHEFNPAMQEEAYAWLDRHLKA